MKRILKQNCIFTMCKSNKPVEKIISGETIVFEVYDCYNNQIKNESDLFSDINKELNNPATGPLFVEDAEPGDILKIHILDIKTDAGGVMTVRPNTGALAGLFSEYKSKIIPIKDNKAIFNEKIQIPVNPMVGGIGVSPIGKRVKTTIPGMHGGNLDCKRISKGSIVYLPVYIRGGLLSISDVHAVMSDGEIVICGLEVYGEVTIKVDVIKNKTLPLPIVIEGNHIMTISSKRTLDQATRQATMNMHKFLVEELEMNTYEAGMILSLVGNLKVCQIVNPLVTARMEFPLSILEKYDYEMI